jgi:diadenosine tetraphosphate (Ap4A) HIT family hydrolase
MYVQLLKKEEEQGFIHELQFRIYAENTLDSVLGRLPMLLSLLSDKSLSSYALHFIPNQYGRFDIEISSVHPKVSDNLSMINLSKKVGRLHGLFYEEPINSEVALDYMDFIHFLLSYQPKYTSQDDSSLFHHATRWYGLAETYAFLSGNADVEDDAYYQLLQQANKRLVLPALGDTHCSFDQSFFLETQVIAKFNHFLLGVNYRPIGNSPFHMMIIPHNHAADLKHARPAHMFEFETMLRATWHLWQENDKKMHSYLQKHVQSGMSVPHMHAHVLCSSEQQAFCDDILQQLRYFALLWLGQNGEARALLRGPLSRETMHDIIRQFKQPMQKAFEYESKVQHQFKVHRPSRLN